METMRDRYEQALDELTLTVRSPGGWVTLHRNSAGVVTVELRRNTLRQISELRLAAELQAVFNEAYRTYRVQSRELRRRIFGADYDEIQDARSV
jgi:hypothetical protein